MYHELNSQKVNCILNVFKQPLNTCFQTCRACSAVSTNNRVMFGNSEVRPEFADESVGVPVGDDGAMEPPGWLAMESVGCSVISDKSGFGHNIGIGIPHADQRSGLVALVKVSPPMVALK